MWCALLAGCRGESDDLVMLGAPSAEKVAAIENDTSTESLRFATAQSLEGADFGLVGDGTTDNTLAFQLLLGTGNRTIHIAAGDYLTGKLTIPSRTELLLDPGVILRDSGQLGPGERFINIVRVEDVRIEGLGAAVVAKRSDYTTGEQRHGVYIFRAKRVVVNGLQSSSHGGDGFYIGDRATDIVLAGCYGSDNRRQGLSITSARRVRIMHSEFVNTHGTAPAAGIDLEPNNANDILDDISILRPRTSDNDGGGILLYLDKLDERSEPVSITIVEHRSSGERSSRSKIPKRFESMIRYSRDWQVEM
jgi:hypothetical protein